MNTYDFSEYYPAIKVAELLGLEKNTILNRCRNGYYVGAIKTTPEVHPPHGQWLIPKALIDTPHLVQDVATLTRQISPVELERSITAAITNSITQAIDPLQQKIEDQNQKIEEQSAKIDQLQKQNNEIIQNIDNMETSTKMIKKDTETIITNTRLEKNSSKSNYGEIITIGIFLLIIILVSLHLFGVIDIIKIFKA